MNRCPYCGHRCHGRTCQYHADLPRLEDRIEILWETTYDQLPTMREELRRARKHADKR